MKKIRPLIRARVVVSRGSTERRGVAATTKLLLTPIAAVSLVAAGVACGSYSAPAGAGGSSSANGGSAVVSTGGSAVSGGTGTGAGTGAGAGAGVQGNSAGSANGGALGTNGGSGNDAGSSTGGASTAGTSSGGTGVGGGSAGAAGGASIALPCGILSSGGNTCVSAHSTVRVIVPGYTGPLYQVCKGTADIGPSSCKGTPQDIGSKDGYADSAAQDTFCGTGACKITKIYDQSGMKNDLEPSPSGGVASGRTPDQPADAAGLKLTINGHSAYGILIKPGMGYRTGCSGCNIKTGNGMATGDAPQTMYWVTSQKDLVNNCCFDYGNAETTSNDDGNGTMEALYMGGGVVWGTGTGGVPGPWVEADLENGLYAGWERNQDQGISTNTPLKYDFVTGILLGDTQEKNANAGRFALYGGDATAGTLKTMYDGIRPSKGGYKPMKKQGSIILGTGGDNSRGGGGHFYEGAIATGPVASKQTLDSLQAAIVATNYGK
jgi:non-reducing end alpha-L-arabinofuranosidase